MNVINDWTSFLWTFPLHQKSDVLSTIQAWVKHIEAESNKCIGELRFDGSGLNLNALHTWCEEEGY